MKKHILFIINLLYLTFIFSTSMAVVPEDEEDYIIIDDYDAYLDSLRNANNPDLEFSYSEPDPSYNGPSPAKIAKSIENSNVPTSVTIDKTTKVVGEIPIQSDVSPSGAMMHTVPIELYPGLREMQPQLALVYNSQAGNGVMGVGWNISGLSSIIRVNKNLYYNDKTDGIKLTKDDDFMLDGNRLIRLSSTTSQIQYETEDGNVKVTAYLSGNIVKYFTVKYPNGTSGTYGYITNTGTHHLSYPITLLKDVFENSITFTYTHSNNRYLITNIRYGASDRAAVAFTYTTRTDNIISYCAGTEIKEDKRLRKITCSYNNLILRTYEMTYGTEQNSSVLRQIDLSAGSQSVNPLSFFYGSGDASNDPNFTIVRIGDSDNYGYLGYNFSTQSDLRVLTGKLTSSFSDHIVNTWNEPSYNFIRHKRTLLGEVHWKYTNSYTGDEAIHVGPSDGNRVEEYPFIKTEEGFIDFFVVNIGQQDKIVKINNKVVNNKDRLTIKIYDYSVPNYTSPKVAPLKNTYNFDLANAVKHGDAESINPKMYYPGDFNGDGKMELLAVSSNKPLNNADFTTKCYLFDLESGSKLYEGYSFDFNLDFNDYNVPLNTKYPLDYNKSDRIIPLDYDGDGKTDICLINNLGTYIYTFDVTGTTHQLKLIGKATAVLNKSVLDRRRLLLGDFNGDGLPDILLACKPNTNDNWHFYYSKGDGQFYNTSYALGSINEDDQIIIQDINNDRYSDIIKENGTNVISYINNPTSRTFVPFVAERPNFDKAILSPINSHMLVSKPNAKLLIIGNHVKGNENISRPISVYTFSSNGIKEKLMTGMVDSRGKILHVSYNLLDENNLNGYSGSSYTINGSIDFPHSYYNNGLNIATKVEVYQDNIKYESWGYAYQNAVIHKQGLGFRGFEKIMKIDQIRNRIYTDTYNPRNFGVLMESDSPFSTITNNYSVTVNPNKTKKVSLISQVSFDRMRALTTRVFYTYDNYGYPTRITTNYQDGATIINDMVYDHKNTASLYYLGLPDAQETTTTWQNSIYKQKSKFEDYTYTGQYKNRYDYISIDNAAYKLALSTNYTYDARGNIMKQQEKSYLSSQITEYNYEYDGEGRLTRDVSPVTREIFNFYSYNSKGLLESVHDHKGYATRYAYDVWGRTTAIEYPTGEIENRSYVWGDNSVSNPGLYGIKTAYTYNSQPEQSVHYDGLGREAFIVSKYVDGVYRKTAKAYDNFGRLSTESLPYTSGTPLVKTYSYDNLDRITSIIEPSGKTTSYAYSGRTVTTEKNGISTEQFIDCMGRLLFSTDQGGTVQYNRRADGQPSSIELGNIRTSFTYDAYGRRTGITDPSAGTQTFTYDAAGNLASQTDANGKRITMAYDQYNRLTNRTCPEFSTTYTYNADNLLEEESSTNKAFNYYEYDSLGRVRVERSGLSGIKYLQKEYTYSRDNLSSVKYTLYEPTADMGGTIIKPLSWGTVNPGVLGDVEVLGTEAYTYAHGHLKKITFNADPVWELTTVNALNQPMAVTTGPLTRTYSYDPYGFPTGRNTKKGVQTVGQQFNYSFDRNKGNLSSRITTIGNVIKPESFAYDSLNRLTGYGGKSIEYNEKGNITNKSDVGAYTYAAPGKPYAVSRVADGGNFGSIAEQTVQYTSFQRPAAIAQGADSVLFTYHAGGDRVKMVQKRNHTITFTRYYLGGSCEVDVGGPYKIRRLYVGGDAYSAPMVRVKENKVWKTYYIGRDYLGSIVNLYDSAGNPVEQNYYDAWGNLGNYQTQAIYLADDQPTLLLGRGYTGHEHLPGFGLINMNARLYDPMLGRFLAPDPYVQAPEFSQSFNRYTYALNNPLVYVDENGEFLFGFIAGFWKGVFTGKNVFKSAWEGGVNEVKIWGGLFTSDSRKNNFWGQAWEILSRFTWQLPQTIAGNFYSRVSNGLGQVDNVDYWGGATVLNGNFWNRGGAVTLGSYINGSRSLKADPHNRLFQHEYGHYLQSQSMGWSYFPKIGIPSIMSANHANNHSDYDHSYHPAEQDANARAIEYFTKHETSKFLDENGMLIGWDLDYHPVIGYDAPKL